MSGSCQPPISNGGDFRCSPFSSKMTPHALERGHKCSAVRSTLEGAYLHLQCCMLLRFEAKLAASEAYRLLTNSVMRAAFESHLPSMYRVLFARKNFLSLASNPGLPDYGAFQGRVSPLSHQTEVQWQTRLIEIRRKFKYLNWSEFLIFFFIFELSHFLKLFRNQPNFLKWRNKKFRCLWRISGLGVTQPKSAWLGLIVMKTRDLTRELKNELSIWVDKSNSMRIHKNILVSIPRKTRSQAFEVCQWARSVERAAIIMLLY